MKPNGGATLASIGSQPYVLFAAIAAGLLARAAVLWFATNDVIVDKATSTMKKKKPTKRKVKGTSNKVAAKKSSTVKSSTKKKKLCSQSPSQLSLRTS